MQKRFPGEKISDRKRGVEKRRVDVLAINRETKSH